MTSKSRMDAYERLTKTLTNSYATERRWFDASDAYEPAMQAMLAGREAEAVELLKQFRNAVGDGWRKRAHSHGLIATADFVNVRGGGPVMKIWVIEQYNFVSDYPSWEVNIDLGLFASEEAAQRFVDECNEQFEAQKRSYNDAVAKWHAERTKARKVLTDAGLKDTLMPISDYPIRPEMLQVRVCKDPIEVQS